MPSILVTGLTVNAELAVSSLSVSVNHRQYALRLYPQRDGLAELAWVST